MLPAENFIDSSIGQKLQNHRNVPTDSPNEPKKATAYFAMESL